MENRSKRGIAGSLLFALFDRDPLWMIIRGENAVDDKTHWYFAHEQEQQAIDGNQSIWDWSSTALAGGSVSTRLSPPEFLDQVMPMDITLVAQNEYGLSAWKVIIGVEILNVGGGLSVDDITNEEQATFVARTMTPWVPWTGKSQTQDTVQVPGGETGMFYGTGTPAPDESTIPTLDQGVIDAYKEWAGID
jgi:hypothetical protein